MHYLKTHSPLPMWLLKERNLDMSDEWKYKYIFNSPVNVSSFGGSISRTWSFFDILSANYHLVTWLVSLLAVSSVELSETELRFKHSTRQMLLRRTSTKLLIGILFEQPWQRPVFASSLKAIKVTVTSVTICHEPSVTWSRPRPLSRQRDLLVSGGGGVMSWLAWPSPELLSAEPKIPWLGCTRLVLTPRW